MVRCRLPHRRLLASVYLATMLATGAGVHPALNAPGRLCSLTVQSSQSPSNLAPPILARVMVRAGDQLVATATRMDGTAGRRPARFLLACGDYEVSVDGDAGGGVGTLVTTTVRLDRDRAIVLDL